MAQSPAKRQCVHPEPVPVTWDDIREHLPAGLHLDIGPIPFTATQLRGQRMALRFTTTELCTWSRIEDEFVPVRLSCVLFACHIGYYTGRHSCDSE